MWKAFGADWRAEQVGTQFPCLSLKGCALGSLPLQPTAEAAPRSSHSFYESQIRLNNERCDSSHHYEVEAISGYFQVNLPVWEPVRVRRIINSGHPQKLEDALAGAEFEHLESLRLD